MRHRASNLPELRKLPLFRDETGPDFVATVLPPPVKTVKVRTAHVKPVPLAGQFGAAAADYNRMRRGAQLPRWGFSRNNRE